jgi:hypothetical protein
MIPLSELKTKKRLERLGYWYIRAGRSHGIWDFVAVNRREVLFVQAKLRQGPDEEEWARLRAFTDHPQNARKEVWIWTKGSGDPKVIPIQEVSHVSVQD